MQSADADRTVPPPAHPPARRSSRTQRRPDADQRLLRVHARSPSPQTRETLTRRYLPMAHAIASRYAFGTELWDDLFQVACIGLVHAIDRYDPDRRASFSSFAYPTIQGELLRHLVGDGSVRLDLVDVEAVQELQILRPRLEERPLVVLEVHPHERPE